MLLASPAWASEQPPELWSWFKDLEKSKEACEIQSSYILQSIALENQIENEYGIYGNVKSLIALSLSVSKYPKPQASS